MNKYDEASLITPTASSDSFADNTLRIALDIGEGLLTSGAEVRRVEYAIEKICHAYGAAHVEVFSINSLILASVRMPDGSYSAQTRRILNSSNHLLCLERYNSLSRRICAETPDFDEIDEAIRKIKQKAKYPFWLILIGNILAASAFAILFGGSLRDALATGIVAIFIALLFQLESQYLNGITKTLLISFFAGLLICVTMMLGIGENMDMVVIGTIMLLIPGLFLGNATRDLLYGDTLAGSLKVVQALISAVMIAIGYAMALFLLGRYCPVYNGGAPFGAVEGMIIKGICSVIGTVGFALTFKISLSKLWIVALCGLATYTAYETMLALTASVLIAAFVSSILLAILSEVCARLMHTPSNVFLFTGCIPIVPGGGLYYSMYNLLTFENETALTYVSSTLQILLGIALGLILTSVAFGMLLETVEKIKKKAK